MSSSLRVMKFGGTSVGDAECMRRAAAIVQSAAAQGPVVVVVSAMSGVTNRLIDAAHRAEAGESAVIGKLIGELGDQHRAALRAMVPDSSAAIAIDKELHAVLAELDRLLQGTALLSELTPRVLDAISGMGERLSAPSSSQRVDLRDRRHCDRRPSWPRRTAHETNAAEGRGPPAPPA